MKKKLKKIKWKDPNPIRGIYKITNKMNNKVYIGYSNNIRTRWYQHKTKLRHDKHSNIYLSNHWRDYGEDNFSFEIIEEIKLIEMFQWLIDDDLRKRERYWIKFYDSFKSGYNKDGGGGESQDWKRKRNEEINYRYKVYLFGEEYVKDEELHYKKWFFLRDLKNKLEIQKLPLAESWKRSKKMENKNARVKELEKVFEDIFLLEEIIKELETNNSIKRKKIRNKRMKQYPSLTIFY